MVGPRGTIVPASIARLFHHDRQARPPRQGSSNGRDEVMNLHRLRWLGHVLRMPEHRLPRRAMLTSIGDGWKRVRGGQTETSH